jgi:putative DNA primase/helicase
LFDRETCDVASTRLPGHFKKDISMLPELRSMIKGYLELGLALHWLPPKQKAIFETGWSEKPVATLAELEQSYRLGANLGVRTGTWSKPALGSGLLVLDVDLRSEDHADECYTEVDRLLGNPSVFPCVVSGRGMGGHYYFSCPLDDLPGKANETLAKNGEYWKLELFSTGKQVVLPPSVHPDTGAPYTWPKFPRNGFPRVPSTVLEAYAEASKTEEEGSKKDRHTILTGSRNDTLFKWGCGMQGTGVADIEITQKLVMMNAEQCQPPLPEREVERIIQSVRDYPKGFRQTDVGNAERLVAMFGNEFRWEPEEQSWYTWAGTHWKRGGDILPFAKAMVRSMYEQRELSEWAKQSESLHRLRAMIELTKSDVSLDQSRITADLWLFNCTNGTIDLRTGELLPHRQEDYITKLSPVPFEPDYRLDAWERYLDVVTQGDHGLRTYLQKVAGLALVGELREKALFIVRGPKNSGKSTFLEALRAMMGDYALSADFEKTFGQIQRNGGASPELARLAGARLVVCSEIEPGTKVSQHLVKRVTGGDPLTARHLFKGYFDFRPQFTLLLVCNDDIRFTLEDDAMWERIKRIPFPFTIPKSDQDKGLQTVLQDPKMGGKAVLAWAVQGCLLWQQERLLEPEAVIQSTLAYRQELDPLAEWFGDCIELEPE